jgi:hypothetical protein
MGYVKLKKAGTAFDVLSGEGVADVKIGASAKAGKISVQYIGDVANEILIEPTDWVVGTASTHFVQADVQAIDKAIGLIGGGSGIIDTDALTKTVASATYAAL